LHEFLHILFIFIPFLLLCSLLNKLNYSELYILLIIYLLFLLLFLMLHLLIHFTFFLNA
jgi:hypothetical protein